jgi:hypothetical protein
MDYREREGGMTRLGRSGARLVSVEFGRLHRRIGRWWVRDGLHVWVGGLGVHLWLVGRPHVQFERMRGWRGKRRGA